MADGNARGTLVAFSTNPPLPISYEPEEFSPVGKKPAQVLRTTILLPAKDPAKMNKTQLMSPLSLEDSLNRNNDSDSSNTSGVISASSIIIDNYSSNAALCLEDKNFLLCNNMMAGARVNLNSLILQYEPEPDEDDGSCCYNNEETFLLKSPLKDESPEDVVLIQTEDEKTGYVPSEHKSGIDMLGAVPEDAPLLSYVSSMAKTMAVSNSSSASSGTSSNKPASKR